MTGSSGDQQVPANSQRGGVVEGAGGSEATWDAALLRGGGHLLQSWRWGEFKRRHGWQVERVAMDAPGGGAMGQVLYRHRGPVSIGYLPRGPVAFGGEAGVRRLFEAIDRASGRHRALSLVVEPNVRLPLTGRYKHSGFVRGPDHLQPSRTVKVPLLDDDALLAQMHAKTRYNVRMALRRGVDVERAAVERGAVDQFYELLLDTARRNAFVVHAREYYADFLNVFGDRAALLFARVDGRIVAGAIAARFGPEAIYMYGASSSEHRAHGAAFLLQYDAMRWAREVGCERYDLWGIPAVDPATIADDAGERVAATRGDDRRGLYEFKVRFGGAIVSLPPTLERRYRPVLAAVARRVYPSNG